MKIKDEEYKLLEEFNNSDFKYNSDNTILDLFSEQVEKVPNNLAVSFEDHNLTYVELANSSNQFANYLVDVFQIKKGDFIGLMIERSEWLVIGILGILKTGAAYVPISIEYPQIRKDYIKNDSNCKIIIDAALIEDFNAKKDQYSGEIITKINLSPNDLIYILYTSGTTGNPKGVMIEHRSVVNLISFQTQLYKIDESERLLQFSNYFFDASVEQFFLSLLNGASLFIISKEKLKNHLLPSFIGENRITHLHATPSYLETLPDLSKLTSLKRIIAGGEVCSVKLAERFGRTCDFYNKYGPTEATVTTTLHKYNHDDKEKGSLSIGKPIGNSKVHILSETLDLLPIGEIGELCIAGNGLARGYLNLPKLTSDRFIPNPFDPESKLYRTGDFAKWSRNGSIEFIGRKDDQVKIRGYRMELGEIEAALNSLPQIKRAVVIASDYKVKEKRLVAYIQFIQGDGQKLSVRDQLLEILPEYMVPTIYIPVDNFQKTPNGKIDRKNLPDPINERPDSAPILRKPRTQTEKNIGKIWIEQLGISEVGIDDNFFEMGGTSLLSQKVSAQISQQLNLEVPVTKLYQYPTIAELSKFLQLDGEFDDVFKIIKRKDKSQISDIAVIGMAVRFPGADSINELWEVLKNAKETISFFTKEELDKNIPEVLRNDPLYVGARGIVPSAKKFDAKFFGINPKLAEAMDPQQRLFLEVAWEVLEQSGYLPKHYKGSVGVYAGCGANSYYPKNVIPNKDLANQLGDFLVNIANDKGYVATRTAYHLNLKGPAVSVHSACSTSLLAIGQAVEAIRSGQCNVAIAGGSAVTSPMHSGHLYQEGSMQSSNGSCRSFDEEGKGTVFSDGAGVVLLKSLEDAKKDGDIIHGVIKGIGITNDGGNKGSFTAPSAVGQAGAISKALYDAGVKPSEISYLEAHGTATPLGDPIEIEGLRMAFGKQEVNGYCAIGSIKSNMGHLTAAAGVAGFIKTILALKHQKIPASLGFKKPNPAIDFENSPFFVNTELRDWKSKNPRKAGISSFGVGGTNVHVVVEEFETKQKTSGESKPLKLLTWSAKTENSREGYKEALGNFIKSSAEINVSDVAYSLNFTRDTFNKRSFALTNDSENATSQLLGDDLTAINSADLKIVPSNLAFLFPGQGAQYLQMGKALYDHENVFKEAVDQCAENLLKEFDFDIRHIIYPKENFLEAEKALKDTQFTQPALFVVEYALSQLWMSWGIQPTILCGHSIGEFVAAHLAGIFTLKDALILVAIRGKLVSELPGGSMLSVRTNYENLSELLPKTLSIAAVNSDVLCVVSGEDKPVEAFAKLLEEKEIPNRLLKTSHAFHSSMMNPVLEKFEAEVKKTTLNVPRVPIISTVTGKWLTDTEATDPQYWTNHLRATVNFSEAMETALGLDDILLLEVGPGRALTTLSQQKKRTKSASSIATLVVPNENENSYHTVLSALGQLWLKGIEPNWKEFYKGQSRQKVWLPAYVFDRKPCWVDPPTTEITAHSLNNSNEPHIIQSIQTNMDTVKQPDRKITILKKISEIILNTSGIELEANEYNQSFLEFGLDSLVLTQMSITCKNEFNLPITFRQLNDEFSSPELLANYLDANLPKDRYAPQQNFEPPTPVSRSIYDTGNNAVSAMQFNHYTNNNTPNRVDVNQNTALSLIGQQLQLLGQQLNLLQTSGNEIRETVQPKNTEVAQVNRLSEELSEEEKKEHKLPFGASPRIEKKSTQINNVHHKFLADLTLRYNKKTAGSKAYAQKHRAHMSDPRVVSGFKPLTKELVYPIVIKKSSGNRLWDLDGNEYLDALNGFGSCFFGHQPDFIKKALHEQVDNGFEIGPQHPLAGEVCELLCEFTGHDRAALCNTGSEAVLGAMRIARTVTGRSLIVAFSRAYHGINDEVIVRGSKKLKTFPAAAGIMPEAVQNMLILDYGTKESLDIIRERANELAGVIVEPVQSRRPDFQPIEFLKELRRITKESDTTLIFDEIITGFRSHPGGAQALFDVKADVATYGKVIGGGISIGAILGAKKYMDALDGGFWQFGDDSYPEAGVTYFAGTFVRHPLALATTKATLLYMKEKGIKLQNRLAAMTSRLASELNEEFERKKLPLEINYFSSLWRLKFLEEIPFSELFFVLMREKGIHIWDGFPCYLTDAYTEEDITRLIKTFIECVEELTAVGIFHSEIKNEPISTSNKSLTETLNTPPIPGARLGIDDSGNPAWFILKDKNSGEFTKVEL